MAHETKWRKTEMWGAADFQIRIVDSSVVGGGVVLCCDSLSARSQSKRCFLFVCKFLGFGMETKKRNFF